jgi:hypothetical protein
MVCLASCAGSLIVKVIIKSICSVSTDYDWGVIGIAVFVLLVIETTLSWSFNLLAIHYVLTVDYGALVEDSKYSFGVLILLIKVQRRYLYISVVLRFVLRQIKNLVVQIIPLLKPMSYIHFSLNLRVVQYVATLQVIIQLHQLRLINAVIILHFLVIKCIPLRSFTIW